VTKTASDLAPNEGQILTYTITASNDAASSAAATAVVVQDVLPVGVTYLPDSAVPPAIVAGGQLTWDGIEIAPGASVTLTFQAVVSAGTAGDSLPNTVTIQGAETDPDLSNNSFTQTSQVGDAVDLQVSKAVDNPSPQIGDLVSFTILVTNDPASSAAGTGVVVRDQLPQELRFLSASPGGLFDDVSREVTWSGVTIEAGQSIEFTLQALVEPFAAGHLLENVSLVGGTVPDPDLNDNRSAVSIAVGSAIQFIAPLSVYRPAGSLQASVLVSDLTPMPGLATIAGHKWNDINQNGAWDAGELGRPGWRFALEDSNGSAVVDVADQPVTDTAGRYVFKDLAPGTYTVREVPIQADGVFEIRSASEFQVTVGADEILAGRFGVTEAPNFGVFDYSPFIRPADAFAARLGDSTLVTATMPWQVFTVNNTSQDALVISSIDTSGISGIGADLIGLRELAPSGALSDVSLPISLGAGQSRSFLVTYDPAIRNGDMVTEQFPDWLGDARSDHPAHRFAEGDRILLETDRAIPFVVELVGGSTYDSDIAYDGVVDIGDLGRLAEALDDTIFDPTSDINARCPNGAEAILDSCVWPIDGVPSREIALGDFGTLDREFVGSARPPFLDLDPTDRSGLPGSDFLVETTNGIASISAKDARFANNRTRVLESLTVAITNPSPGDSLRVDAAFLRRVLPGMPLSFNGGSAEGLGDTTTITVTGQAAVNQYAQVLQAITFEGSTSLGRLVVVRVQALGSQSPDGPFTRSVDDEELVSNVSLARIVIPPPVVAAAPLTALVLSERLTTLAAAESEEEELCLPQPTGWMPFTSDPLRAVAVEGMYGPLRPRDWLAPVPIDDHIDDHIDGTVYGICLETSAELFHDVAAPLDLPLLASFPRKDDELASAVDQAMREFETLLV
jgi:uncharacterized repeat protein (TIGR01451 family)